MTRSEIRGLVCEGSEISYKRVTASSRTVLIFRSVRNVRLEIYGGALVILRGICICLHYPRVGCYKSTLA